MKKLAFVLLMVALLTMFSATLAQAQPSVPEYGAEFAPEALGEQGGPWVFETMVDKGFPCGLGTYGVTTYSHAVMARNGIQTLVCAGQVPPGQEPDTAVIEKGFQCGLRFLGIWTYVSQLTVTPSGRVNLTCHTMQSVHE